MTRPILRALLAMAMVLLGIMALSPATAFAHGRLKSSVPASGAHLAEVPREIRLRFSEAAELAFTTIRLLAADGREVTLGAVRATDSTRREVVALVTGALEAGRYAVLWQVAGADGHPVRGQYTFVVAPGAAGTEAPAALPAPADSNAHSAATMPEVRHDPVMMPQGPGFGAESPLYAAVRWLNFVAVLLVVGAVSFRTLVVARLRRSGTTEGAWLDEVERDAARVGYVAALALGVALALRLVAQSYAMHGGTEALSVAVMGQMIHRTTWGWGWLLQLVGVLLSTTGLYGAWRLARRRTSGDAAAIGQRPWWTMAAAGAMAAAFSPALSGHAAAVPSLRALAVFADGVHVLSASAWLGTLAVLFVAGLAAARRQAEGPAMVVRTLVAAFSPVALWSAALAAGTGVIATWLHVGTIPNLWGTRYGLTLLLKLALVALVALLGAYNWRVVQPGLAAEGGVGRLRRSARAEVAVALLVLLVTAVLVATPPSVDAGL